MAGGASPSPTDFEDTFQVWAGETLGPPARMRPPKRRAGEGTRPYGGSRRRAKSWPRPASSRPKSRRFAAVGLEMRLRARSCPAGQFTFSHPTGFNSGKLVRQSQAQFLNRTSGKFLPTQGPSGPEWKRRQALLVLRAGRVQTRLMNGPRKWGPRGRRIWTRSVHPELPPSGSLVAFWPSRKPLAARRRRNPLYFPFPLPLALFFPKTCAIMAVCLGYVRRKEVLV